MFQILLLSLVLVVLILILVLQLFARLDKKSGTTVRSSAIIRHEGTTYLFITMADGNVWAHEVTVQQDRWSLVGTYKYVGNFWGISSAKEPPLK